MRSLWSKATSSSSSKLSPPRVEVKFPGYSTFAVSPRPSNPEEPPETLELKGEAEIHIEKGWGPRACRGMRIVLRCVVSLDMDAERVNETDTIFEHHLLLPISEDGGIVLEEGPANLVHFSLFYSTEWAASDDILNHNNIRYYVIFQAIGKEPSLPSPEAHLDLAELEKEDRFVPFPLNKSGALPLERTITGYSLVHIVHAQEANGAVVPLDNYASTLAPELGMVQIHATSTEFSVAGPITVELECPEPSDTVTIYGVRYSVLQQETLESPRDNSAKTSKVLCPFVSIGNVSGKPEKEDFDTVKYLWQGKEVGGKDKGRYHLKVETRLPHSSTCRQSTLPGLSTPITLKHWLVYDIFYSIRDINESGQSIDEVPEKKKLSIRRSIILPHCSLINDMMELPNYGSTTTLKAYKDTPCSACGQNPSTLLCEGCSGHRIIPHLKKRDRDINNSDILQPCEKCSGMVLDQKAPPDHNFAGECACVHWNRWRFRRGASQAAVVPPTLIEDGDSAFSETIVDADRQLAIKLQGEDGPSRFKGS